MDIWEWPLVVGGSLPVVPLSLSGLDVVPLDLEGTYHDVCQRRLIDL